MGEVDDKSGHKLEQCCAKHQVSFRLNIENVEHKESKKQGKVNVAKMHMHV